MAKPSSKKKGTTVDFTDVETRVLVPEGEYRAKVKAVEEDESNAGNTYLKWQFTTVDDDKKLNGQTLYYHTSLQPQALWNLRNLLETLGVETPNGKYVLDAAAYIGLECMVTVEHETYEGKKKAKISDFAPLEAEAEDDEAEEEEETEEVEEEAEEEETEEEETEEEEEEEEEITADEVKAMKLEELQDLAKKLKISKPSNMPKKLRAQVLDALEKANAA
jgi:hypothetical protein